MPKGSKREPPSPGERVGRLVAVTTDFDEEKRQTLVIAECDCGEERVILFRKWGTTKSCGCLQKEAASRTWSKHGMSDTRLHRVWRGMKQRCNNPNRPEYANYGGRGISVCPEWDDFAEFARWAEENGYDDELDIDRIDNDGDYSPENCRFVTRSENLRNNRRSTEAEAFGETKSIAEWADDNRCQVSHHTLYTRIRRGWEAKDAILTPKGRWNPKRRT